MKRNVKIIIVVVVAVLMVAYGVYAYLQPMAVETKTLVAQTSEITFTESGLVVHSGDKVIYPLAPGEVVSVLVKEGDKVRAGQVLAELDKEILKAQIAQASTLLEGYRAQKISGELEHEINILNLKANRSQLVGQLKTLDVSSGTKDQRELEKLLEAQSKEILEQGLIDLEKNKELLALGVISQSDYIAFEQLVKTYEANYIQSQISAAGGDDYYEATRAALNAQIAAIDATLEMDTLSPTIAYYESLIAGGQASLDALMSQSEMYSITSPVDGVINSVSIENTNMVSGVEPAFIVQGMGTAQIEVKVSTRDISSVTVGDPVRIILDQRSGDLELTGTVAYVATNAVAEVSPLGIEERKVLVYVTPDAIEGLGAGYEVDVKFVVFSQGGQLMVPNSALYKVDGQDTVMIIRKGKAVEVPVVLGYEMTGETIVDQGLAEGDQLIIDLDISGLSPGRNVASSNE